MRTVEDMLEEIEQKDDQLDGLIRKEYKTRTEKQALEKELMGMAEGDVVTSRKMIEGVVKILNRYSKQIEEGN